jgi:hypothetical protein
MAGEDPEATRPSLELPKLRRRRREPKVAEPAVPVEPEERAAPVELVEPVTEPIAVQTVEIEPGARRRRRTPRLRRLGGMPAALLTGVIVGLGLVGLTWAALRGCEAIQGTPSCGGTGYPMLVAILALLVVVGWLLLRLNRVPEPGSTSFLAVGLTAVLALLFLVDSLMDHAMIVVLPVLCAGAFAAAYWVTRTFSEPQR